MSKDAEYEIVLHRFVYDTSVMVLLLSRPQSFFLHVLVSQLSHSKMKLKKISHNPYNAKKQKVTTLKKYCQKTWKRAEYLSLDPTGTSMQNVCSQNKTARSIAFGRPMT